MTGDQVVPVVVAVLVAWLGFRYALRQDERRWSRDRRADLYVDLLANESAEHDWLTHRIAEIEAGEAIPPVGPDDRLNSADRRRLGARAAAYGSREVVRRWNAGGGVAMRALLGQDPSPLARVHAGAAMDALEAQIRYELETERLPWWGRIRRPTAAPDDLARLREGEQKWRAKVAEDMGSTEEPSPPE